MPTIQHFLSFLGFCVKAGLTFVLPWAKNTSVAGVGCFTFFSKSDARLGVKIHQNGHFLLFLRKFKRYNSID
jgi:hypothetical protein